MKKKFYSALLCVTLFFTCGIAQDMRVWATYYGGTGNESGVCVATDASGNVFMAGITMSNGMAFNGFQNTFGGGNVDAYLVKFSPSGARLWATYYGGPGNEMTFFGGKIGLATDTSGNVYLAGLSDSQTGIASTGSFQSTNGGGMDAYLVKFDAAGNRIWATYYGGASADVGYAVTVDVAQNVYLGGVTGSAGMASNGFQNTMNGTGDAFLAKFDPAGNRIWATYYGGPANEEGLSVVTDADGNVYLAGSTFSTSGIASGGFQNFFGGGGFDAFLVKFDSTGARAWATYYGGTGDEMYPYSGDIEVTCDESGYIYLCGMTSSTTGIATSGGHQNTHGGGQYDVFLVKFDYSGNRSWATYYGGTGDDKAYHVAVDTAGNVFLAARTTSAAAIASGGFQTTYGNNEDACLVKFNSIGFRLCATYYGGFDYDDCDGMAIDNAGNAYMSGGTANMSGMTSGGFQNLFGGGSSDAFLVKFTSCNNPLQTEEIISTNDIIIYPNPSNGKFIIEETNFENGIIEIFDMFGQLIYSESNFNQRKEIDISGVAKGIYFVRVSGGTMNYTRKIVVE